jgi:hypothetical protein
MVKITAPVSLAMDVLDLLDRDFYNRARIMPTHDNVVKTLQFQRSLNDHRRRTGEYAAITYGLKFVGGDAAGTTTGAAKRKGTGGRPGSRRRQQNRR